MNYKHYFPWFKHNPDYTYFDSAATSLKPQSVIDAINEYYLSQSTNPHNNDSPFAYQANAILSATRKQIADWWNTDDDESIIFTSGATESINTIAFGLKHLLKPGDEIVLTTSEHASNLLPWYVLQKEIGVKIIFANPKNKLPQVSDFAKVLTSKTKIVAFASGGNLVGHVLDENEITNIVKRYNKDILVLVDATQSVQHRPINLQNSDIDFVVCSAHKIFGPTGIGAMYIQPALINLIRPLKYGGGMNSYIEANDFGIFDNYMRFEGGSPHTAGVYGFNAALKFIKQIGYDTILEHERELMNYAVSRLKEIPAIKMYIPEHFSATISFNYNGVFAQDLAHYLGRNKIICRAGLSCAKLMNDILDTQAAVRLSFYLYNTKDDIDYLIDVLKKYHKGDELDGLI
ncbi:aminotransferase class V-fold PLP-dependent enzyme [Ureaplasma sp. ES3154-GEN]|uniref:cysteine desulfurase n=1 Tax=Ureaplasma sp. ES3154-GEN TaxID=2984844 RepID=UPI0021E802DB|nr:aminotransferase class V-fold PLP-dependent enzyme [Ureaplasma sp. ES3154-GEN]MCV3743512.1 aminotransferase class V-fold PLP-dependent enzyme [Ureaplasma sp. ES3154-GEN]